MRENIGHATVAVVTPVGSSCIRIHARTCLFVIGVYGGQCCLDTSLRDDGVGRVFGAFQLMRVTQCRREQTVFNIILVICA